MGTGADQGTLLELYEKVAKENIALRIELARAQAEIIILRASLSPEARGQ